MRLLLELILPAVIPALIYLGYLQVEQRRAAQGDAGAPLPWWAQTPWLALAVAGVLLAATVLSVIVVNSGDAINGVYVPAHMDKGTLVPAHVEYPPK